MVDLDGFFKETSRLVEEELERLVPRAEPERLYDAVRWSLFAGGKRFRPALCIAVGRCFGAPDERLLRTAAAIEMIHTYSLIHDDLPAMDDDDLRRGRATCHVKFGEATAILAGDVLQSIAFRTIADDRRLPEPVRVRLLSELAAAAAKMVDGQQLDLEGEGKPVALGELERIHRNKTGAMIRIAAISGAVIASATEDEERAIGEYASGLGLLFQITDDLLDVTETTEVLGKTAGKDEAAEKATYPALLGIEETRKLALEVHREAIGRLEAIANPTATLRSIADFILGRRS